ncbi:methylated-DNA--protein-cysteine methyltransferase [Alphaproteobacteria bacterium]|nr:methylated-DNA--protein-cysteine methyltransferase [Alphaproteobacteria bacterium]
MDYSFAVAGFVFTASLSENVITSLAWHKGETAPASATNSVPASLLRAELAAYFSGRLQKFTVPYRCEHPSAYYQAVWKELANIPYGQTTSYKAIAEKLSTHPRGVARACAANPLPLIIPCHRVLAATGALSGYSGAGGIATKRRLLDLERDHRA